MVFASLQLVSIRAISMANEVRRQKRGLPAESSHRIFGTLVHGNVADCKLALIALTVKSPHPADDGAALVDAVAQGDANALARLYDRHAAWPTRCAS